MAGPWEQYAPQETAFAGPWDNYKVDAATDALKGFGGGVERGVTGFIGLPGTLESLGRTGLNKLGAGVSEDALLPTGQEVLSGYENMRGRPTYQPETTTGQYARTFGEFTPGLIGGPSGIGTRALTNVAAPALVSETAGQLTEGTPLETPARIVGGIAGHSGANIAQNAARRKSLGLPTAEELKDMSQLAYQRAEQAGVAVNPAAVGNLKIQLERATLGGSRVRHSKSLSIIDDIDQTLSTGGPLSLERLESFRQDLVAISKSGDAERFMAGKMLEKIDGFMDTLSPSQVTQGNTAAGVNSLKEARSLWKRMKKTEIVEDIFEGADLRSKTNYAQAGTDTALRKRFEALYNNKKKMRFFSGAERAAIKKVAEGGPVQNLIRRLGAFSPHSVVPAYGILGIGATQGPEAAAAVGIPTALARWMSDRSTSKNAQLAYDLIRGGGPVAPSAPTLPGQIGFGSSLSLPWALPNP
jgi:hypothetical protein